MKTGILSQSNNDDELRQIIAERDQFRARADAAEAQLAKVQFLLGLSIFLPLPSTFVMLQIASHLLEHFCSGVEVGMVVMQNRRQNNCSCASGDGVAGARALASL